MKKSLFKSLYFQVLLAITVGVLLGHFYPDIGAQMKPLGDGFVKLIKMIIAPVIFCTVVTGIAGMESMKAVGRTGAIALLLWGSHMISTALQRGFGTPLRHWMGRHLTNRWMALLAGVGITGLLQSSTTATQAEEALQLLMNYGWEPESLELSPSLAGRMD